ncbi:unnamed protein product, partial [Mycena citricolor]
GCYISIFPLPPMTRAIPVELWDNVASCLRAHDLASLALVDAHLSSIALRALYRDIVISRSRLPGHASLSTLILLSRRRDLSSYVRHFSLNLFSGKDATPGPLGAFYRQLAIALSSMPGLITLDLAVDETAGWILPGNLMYPRLQSFSSSFPLDARVLRWLANVPVLRALQVGDSPSLSPTLAVPPMPRLAEVTGCAEAVAALVPGNPVESIFISAGDFTELTAAALAQSTTPIAALSLATSSAPLPLLETLGRYLPSIIYLQITSTCNLPAPSLNIFYEQMGSALTAFPDLQSFQLSGMYWMSSKHPKHDHRVWQSHLSTTNNATDISTAHPLMNEDLYSADFFFS